VRTQGDNTAGGSLAQHSCGATAFARWRTRDVERSLGARFREQADAHATCLALTDRGRTLTYAELDSLSNGVANSLVARLGPKPQPVPLLFHQGAASTVATLGALKAGKPYVPLDPTDPPARLLDVLRRLDARIVLHDGETAGPVAALTGIEGLDVEDATDDTSAPAVHVSPDDVAYIYFTSGSTGRPKGVFDSHRNVLHNVLRYTNALRIGPADRLTLLQAPAFSGAVSSLFCALLNGAQVFPLRPSELGPQALAELLREERITVYHSVPAIFRTVCSAGGAFPDVRVVRLEGDRASALDLELHGRHFGAESVLANGLGATETGLARQLRTERGSLDGEGVVPVGYAVPDVEVAIVDDAGTEVPQGVSGEIAVRSAYLALGYWDDPALTASSFSPTGDPRVRTYRTGDIGRLRADGCLEHLGRRDSELKVRGHRIDAAEVEDALLRLPSVREAVASTVEGRRGEGRLVAYVVPSGAAPTAVELREALGSRLAAHMIPSRFVFVDEIPLGPNGKLDRRALRAPLEGGTRGPGPRTGLERTVAEVWQEVLEVPVGIDDDFTDLGGDSLAAAEILALLEARLVRSISPSLLLRGPTVRRLAEALDERLLRASDDTIVLQPEGTGSPIVLTPSHDGDTAHFRSLLRSLGTDRPVIGLEGHGDLEAGLSIEAAAARHVDALGAAGIRPPYALVGFCFGAIVALEMARCLRSRGEDIALLALIGVTPGEFPTLVDPQALDRWQREHWVLARGSLPARARRHAAHALRLPAGRRLPYLAARTKSLAARTARAVQRPKSRALGAAAARAVRGYDPSPYDGAAVLFLSEVATASYSRHPATDWSRLATGGVTPVVLPGTDEELLQPPAADAIAARILGYLA
jgi:amino acid adenylation domain-containing protein